VPPPRKRTPAAAPADLDGKKAANADSGDLDALRAEVAGEPDTEPDLFVVPLAGTSVRVKHWLDWPTSADELLVAGRLTLWAEKVLYGDDYAKVWTAVDPTNRQTAAFIRDLEKITGVPLVASAASSAS
jgi:hypothetical protein